jgi:hypothetical protein
MRLRKLSNQSLKKPVWERPPSQAEEIHDYKHTEAHCLQGYDIDRSITVIKISLHFVTKSFTLVPAFGGNNGFKNTATLSDMEFRLYF